MLWTKGDVFPLCFSTGTCVSSIVYFKRANVYSIFHLHFLFHALLTQNLMVNVLCVVVYVHSNKTSVKVDILKHKEETCLVMEYTICRIDVQHNRSLQGFVMTFYHRKHTAIYYIYIYRERERESERRERGERERNWWAFLIHIQTFLLNSLRPSDAYMRRYVVKLTIIDSDNVTDNIWTNDGILLIGPLGTNFS